MAALAAGEEAGCNARLMSAWRTKGGRTALGSAAAGASTKAGVKAGVVASVPGADRTGASAGALAASGGHRRTAAVLYRGATKAVMRKQGLFRDVRSMMVVRGHYSGIAARAAPGDPS